MTKSKITGKTYDPSEVIYVPNMQQNVFYFKNNLEDQVLDILYTSRNGIDRIVFVYPKNDKTREVYKQWNNNHPNQYIGIIDMKGK